MPKRELIDTSGMVLIFQSNDKTTTEHLSHIVEDDYKKVTHTVRTMEYSNETIQYRQKSISKKWMCIGGPFAGTRKTVGDALKEGYREYNQANRTSDELKVILIHESMFPQAFKEGEVRYQIKSLDGSTRNLPCVCKNNPTAYLMFKGISSKKDDVIIRQQYTNGIWKQIGF